MRLVDYSSDEDEDEEVEESAALAPAKLPALPSDFHDLYSGILGTC